MNPLNTTSQNFCTLPPQMMQNIHQVKRMLHMLRGGPNQMLQQMCNQNPMMQQVMQMCNGQNPKDVFYTQCKKMGVNPDAFLSELQR